MVKNGAPGSEGFSWAAWIKRPRVQTGLLIVGCVIAVYGIIYADVVSRAREAYLKGEKYMAWHADPEAKKKDLQRDFARRKSDLETDLKKGRLSEEEYRERIDALEFDLEFRTNESSLKYAYQWFVDTHELFSPPESKWVKMARAKAPDVLEMWKAELKAQNIPFEDYMFE